MSVKVTKSTDAVELYQVRQGRNFEGWGDIVLICGERSVSVMVRSDYGDYSYHWNATGGCPKSFLISLDQDYVMKNLSDYKNTVPDADANERQTKQYVIQARRARNLTDDEAREAWDSMINLVWEHKDEPNLYGHLLIDQEHFDTVFGDYEYIPSNKKPCPHCTTFFENVWVPFTDQLKVEIQETAELAATTKL